MSLINNHFKTFLISLLSLTLLFSISCSDAYKPSDKDGTRTLSYYAGDWWGILEEGGNESFIFTIDADGSVIIRLGGANKQILSTSITKNSDTSYTGYYAEGSDSLNIHFHFKNDTEGTMTIEDNPDITVTKK